MWASEIDRAGREAMLVTTRTIMDKDNLLTIQADCSRSSESWARAHGKELKLIRREAYREIRRELAMIRSHPRYPSHSYRTNFGARVIIKNSGWLFTNSIYGKPANSLRGGGES